MPLFDYAGTAGIFTGPEAFSPGCIDPGGFLAVCRADREKGGEIYRTCRHLLSLHRLLVRQDNIRLVSQFMGTDLVNVLPYTALRIDIRGEEKYLFEWHQDYPYTQG